jgi:hypothetical protein
MVVKWQVKGFKLLSEDIEGDVYTSLPAVHHHQQPLMNLALNLASRG